VLRDGAAFLSGWTRNEPRFFQFGGVLAVTVYLDALLLGKLQRSILLGYADAIAELDDPVANAVGLAAIERGLARFRNVYWWDNVTTHDDANQVLSAYHSQTGLARIADQVFSEVREYSRQIEVSASRRTAIISTLIGLFGLPLAIAIGVDQSFTLSPTVKAAVLAGAVLLGAIGAALRPMLHAVRNSR
jgi:hypothetical protein